VKSPPSLLAAHYATRSTTLAVCLEIVRKDGAAYRFTSCDKDVVLDGNRYAAGPGLDLSEIAYSAGLATDNLELRILYADNAITRADLLAGRWDNAAFTIREVNYERPQDGSNLLVSGTTGEAHIGRNEGFTIELRSLKQALQKPVGIVTQKTCRNRLGDNNCRVALGPFTRTSVPVTSVESQRVFAASSLAAGSPTLAPGHFTEGLVTFTTGANAGTSRKIRVHGAAGRIECLAPFTFTVQVGDQFTAVAGCQKRLSDCRDKFNNVLNFNGEPHLNGVDAITSLPDAGS
jgi:uncharacterized phage protein (TIGR02218 family)